MRFFKNRSNPSGRLCFAWLSSRATPSDADTHLARNDLGWPAWFFALLMGLAFFLIYASMLPDQPSRANYGGDGGDFVAAMLTGGIPHPSGYPVYTFLGSLFVKLPFAMPYWRAALLSAVAGALAVALAFVWVLRAAQSTRLAAGWLAALTAALAWGSGPLFWSQAVIVEVHALQAVFLVIWLGWINALLAWGERRMAAACLLVYAVLAGVSLGNHLTILLLAPALAMAQFLALKRGMPRRLLLWQAAGVGLGSLVYLYLPWQARSWPPVNWGNPQSLAGLWWLVSGDPYRGLVFGVSTGQWLQRAAAWTEQLVIQFSLPGVLLGVLGLLKAPGLKAEVRLLLVWIFGIVSLFSLGYNTHDALVYLIPAYLVFSIWLGQGVAVLWPLAWGGWPVGRTLALVALLLLLARVLPARALVDPRPFTAQADFALSLLSQAPQGAFLLATGDVDSFPLWYEHFGLGRRVDVRVVVQPLTQFRWYQETLHKTYPDLLVPPFEERSDSAWADALVRLNPDRPVCRSFEDQQSPMQVRFTCQGAP